MLDLELLDRVEQDGLLGCWTWTGARDPHGYGRVSRHLGGSALAHRRIYEAVRGPIPGGLTLDHLCRNTSCVNPAHLEPVTQRENTRRAIWQTHCPQGHQYERLRNGAAFCRPCHREYERNRQRRAGRPAKQYISDDRKVRVRELRSQGFSCRAIGREVGLHSATVSRLLNGRTA